ncbi:MAG: Asp-tRNA(Asn)/Glu-tRNA(Gln) amidotransferase subunit GatB [Candidatus Omnitrophota bacterium]
MNYEAVIGLEVHVQLKTKSKAFCGCSTEFGREPNSNVCPVCLGFPGSLPVLNKQALDYARMVAAGLNCQIQEFTKFDRKNYFYPDLPKNYQISQYDLPLSLKGFVDIRAGGALKRVGITRVHLEEDAGKLIHEGKASLVDFNRAGIPLLEIVSEPDMNSPEEAYEYLTALKSIVQYIGASDCDMEKGFLRCDANISLREKGEKKLGTKTELKNMNSFKGVKDALAFEIKRQEKVLSAGEKIIQETLLWDADAQRTRSMRVKEEAQDYRYFPEPDLPPFVITLDEIEKIKRSLPELPAQRQKRFEETYKFSGSDAALLICSRDVADFFEECVRSYNNPKSVLNWVTGVVMSQMNARAADIIQIGLKPADLAELIKLVEDGKINNIVAKSVLSEVLDTKKSPSTIVREKDLLQVSDEGALAGAIQKVLSDNAKSVSDYKSGKTNALMFLVGQVMRGSGGKVNPKVVSELIKKQLES